MRNKVSENDQFIQLNFNRLLEVVNEMQIVTLALRAIVRLGFDVAVGVTVDTERLIFS